MTRLSIIPVLLASLAFAGCAEQDSPSKSVSSNQEARKASQTDRFVKCLKDRTAFGIEQEGTLVRISRISDLEQSFGARKPIGVVETFTSHKRALASAKDGNAEGFSVEARGRSTLSLLGDTSRPETRVTLACWSR